MSFTTRATSIPTTIDAVAGTDGSAEITHLHRVRRGVRAALALGVAASVGGNILHAEPTFVGRAIAAWSPLALLLTVELISRVPVNDPLLAVLRRLATGVIAGIAAWVSYWHMVSVAGHNGEGIMSAHLLPLSVDGLVVVASVSLVEIAARLQQMATPTALPPVGFVLASAASEPDPHDEDEDDEAEGTLAVPEPRPAPRKTASTRRSGRPVATTAAGVVGRLRAKHPDWTVGQIAEKAGVSQRTVRRHLNPPAVPLPAAEIAA